MSKYGNHVEVYRDSDKEWRWRFWAANGRILADSGEGYEHLTDCIDALEIVRHGSDVVVVMEDDDDN